MLTDKPRFPVKQILLVGFLPSGIKKLVYRLKGYRIGKGVHLGFGSVVCGESVDLGHHVQMGFLSVLRGKTIRVGDHVQIGSVTILDTPHIEIGEGTKINEQVFVGGLQFPDSRFAIGRNCQIMQMTCINPARSIVIGDDTGIGGYCLVFGHTSWLSKFEGYPVDFQPIEIGKSVSVAWRVFITPGVKIGDGAVVGANSLVNQSIPERCLAVGYPARVVSKAPYFPRKVGEAEKELFLQEIVTEMMGYFEGSGMRCRSEGSLYEVQVTKRRWYKPWPKEEIWRFIVESKDRSKGDDAVTQLHDGLNAYLSLRKIAAEMRRELERRRIVWIDIESKERADTSNELAEEIIQYLRRYGVRFYRVSTCSGTKSRVSNDLNTPRFQGASMEAVEQRNTETITSSVSQDGDTERQAGEKTEHKGI